MYIFGNVIVLRLLGEMIPAFEYHISGVTFKGIVNLAPFGKNNPKKGAPEL